MKILLKECWKKKMKENKPAVWKQILFCVLVFLSLACLFGIFYVYRNFVLIGTNPIAQIMFHTIVQIDGADPAFIKGIIRDIVIIPLIGTILVYLFVYGDFGPLKKIHENKFFGFLRKWGLSLSVIAFLISIKILAGEHLQRAEQPRQNHDDTPVLCPLRHHPGGTGDTDDALGGASGQGFELD